MITTVVTVPVTKAVPAPEPALESGLPESLEPQQGNPRAHSDWKHHGNGR